MMAAGFVLAGGRSSRMGRDKALLKLNGQTLVERALGSLREVCSEVAIAGGAEELARFGRLIPDQKAGCGPLEGIVAALEQSSFEWNLFLAVDMPYVPSAVWLRLLERAEDAKAIGVMARSLGQVQPLCAVYARRASGRLREELQAGRWKITAAAAAAGDVECVDFEEEEWFRNLNTQEEFRTSATSVE